jgi:MOSC domain-containing protein YiiM
MRLIALSVGHPRVVEWRGEQVLTSIFKEPVAGSRRVHQLNIDGDKQSDLSVHGGAEKAVYVYASEHYPYWCSALRLPSLPWGAFGENLTTAGLVETEVNIGDRYRIGTAEFTVTQPRTPCYKLNVRFGRADMVKRFHQSGLSGFYLGVVTEGELAAGADIEQTWRDDRGLSVADVARLVATDAGNQALVDKAIEHPALAAGWREYFRRRRWKPDH